MHWQAAACDESHKEVSSRMAQVAGKASPLLFDEPHVLATPGSKELENNNWRKARWTRFFRGQEDKDGVQIVRRRDKVSVSTCE